MLKECYDKLGLPVTATEKEVKAAYKKLAKRYHPDVNPGDKEKENKFKEISVLNIFCFC